MQADVFASVARILIVDDEPPNVRLLERILERAGYRDLRSTTDSREALPLFREMRPDLVLLDLRMPHLDGFDVLRQLSSEVAEDDFLPVLVLTADVSLEAKERGLSSGATDFLSKPFHASEALLRIGNLLHTRLLHLTLRNENRVLGSRLLEQARELERAQREVLDRLAQAVDARDGATGEHTQRVASNAARIAAELGGTAPEAELLRRAAPLHDVGKVGISDALLLKPGKLTPEEFEIVKSHTTVGARMLSGGRSELIRLAERIALSHHERWDGTGYPQGLKGEAIPLEARIVAVADVFDALSHDRPYRPALPLAEVTAMIEADAGKHFDPRVVEAFLRLHREGALTV